MPLHMRLSIAAGLLGLCLLASAQTVLKIGYAVPRDSTFGVGTNTFCEELERGTAGRYKCQQFPGASAGGEREMIEAVQLGTLDAANVSTGTLGNFVPEVRILDIPFLLRNYGHARAVLDGPVGEGLLQRVSAKGLVGLAWTENGFRHMTNSKRPIVTAADAAGLKLRTMENKVHLEGYKAFGVLPTPMPWTEVFTALQQGTVDGQENPISVILSGRLSMVQKHLSLTRHVYSAALILLSPDIWHKASEADRQVLLAAARKGGQAQRARVDADEASGLLQLKKDGMQVVDRVDQESFRKAVAPAYVQFAREFGADRIAAIQAVK